MRKLHNLWLIACLVCLLSGCAASQPDSTEDPSQGPTWQEQYDLGVRYLSDGDYEGAILAFSAAIEIDPKRAPAYVGRGDAYMKSGETESNLAAALADYERATKLDESSAEAYLGLVDVYIRKGDYEKAQETLARGIEKTGDESLQAMLDSIYVEEIDELGRNIYGATAFTRRNSYVAFGEMTEIEQEIIEQVITAVIQGDQKTLLALSESIAEIFSNRSNDLCTIWKQNKICLEPVWTGHKYGAYLVYDWNIEIRPQHDMGYYVRVYDKKFVDPSEITESYYEEYSWCIDTISCPCVDWQWNGTFNAQYYTEALQYWNDGMIRKIQRTDDITGQMKDSLRDGVFTTDIKLIYEYLDSDRESTISEEHFTEQYNRGVYEASVGKYPFETDYDIGKTYTIDQSAYSSYMGFIDRFYW